MSLARLSGPSVGGHPRSPPSQRAVLLPGVVGAIAVAVGTITLSRGSALAFPCRDSCQKGWRLLYILAAYYKCSEVLRPFLLAFLQDASRHPELPFQGRGCACPRVVDAWWGRTPRGITGLQRCSSTPSFTLVSRPHQASPKPASKICGKPCSSVAAASSPAAWSSRPWW